MRPWTLKNQTFANFDKASDDAYNREGLLILLDLLNERVAEGDAFNPHDFNLDSSSIQVVVLPCELLKMSC